MKKIFYLFCVLLLTLTVSGCHGSFGYKPFVIPETFDETKDYEVVFWAKNDTNRNQVAVYNKAIEDFEKLYPNIHINMRLYTDYSRIYNDVITNISTGTTPNVCITYPDHIATYLTGTNIVAELDELLDDERYGLGGSELKYESPTREEMVSEFLDECILEGHYYAIPFMRSTEALYINKTYVEAMGYKIPEIITWDYIWEVSEAALAKDSEGNYLVNGQKVMIPFIYKSTDNMMIQMTEQLGSGYSNDEGEILLFNDTTKKILQEIAGHAKTGAFSTFKISSYPANFLNAGQCIFAIDSTAGSTWMGSKAPLLDISPDQVVDFETEVRIVPQYDVNNIKMISQGPSICVFNKPDSNEVLASWLFAQFLLSNDVQVGYGKTEGYVPVTLKAQQSPAYLEYLSRAGEDDDEHYRIKIEASRILVDHVEESFVTPVFNGSVSLRNAAGQLIENVTRSTIRKESTDDAYMDKLYKDIISLYRLDQTSLTVNDRKDLGPLPSGSKALLGTLAGIWVILGIIKVRELIKKQKN